MKLFYLTIMLSLTFCIAANSQSDTLIIKMKNNQIEKIAVSQIQKITFENLTDVAENKPISSNLQLQGNYPNPFMEQTNIDFEIIGSGNVEIIIYDNSGKQIQILECDNCQPGRNSLQWDCMDLNKNKVKSGIYYYEVQFNNEIQSRKMILVK